MSGMVSCGKILVVDDEGDARAPLVEYLTESGYSVIEVGHPDEALEIARKQHFDLVMTDLRMPGMDGVTLFKKLKELEPEAVGIIMTGFGTIESTVKAIKAGAWDYITKPFQLDETGIIVKRAIEYRRLQIENKGLKKQLLQTHASESLLGSSRAMEEVFQVVRKVADTEATVLLTGESGTGKELVARTLHGSSRRAGKPFVAVNCGAIPEELLESELFGHEKGAFTGAVAARTGLFEMADGGTILLDEIGDMSQNLQVKLLRVLQEREFQRVGGERTKKIDVRVIAATHQDLDRLVEEKKFREDLYYRLNVIQIKLPPLRERLEDLPLLAEHFMDKHGLRKNRQITGISPEAIDILSGYRWPGNVRELENIIERACILKGSGVITASELPEKVFRNERKARISFRLPKDGINITELLEEFENELIAQAMERSGGVKNKAADLLGIGRTTLVGKLKKNKMLPDDQA